MKDLKDIELTPDNPHVQEASKISDDWNAFLDEARKRVVAFHDSTEAFQKKSRDIFEGDNVAVSLVDSEVTVFGGLMAFLLNPNPFTASLLLRFTARHIAVLERAEKEFPHVS